jgi:hypothetical protein
MSDTVPPVASSRRNLSSRFNRIMRVTLTVVLAIAGGLA